MLARLSCTGLSPSLAGFPKTFPLVLLVISAVRTPKCTHFGLGSSAFARRYSQNRCFFLFLRLLRCFSSPGSLCMTMDSPCSDGGLLRRVSPFRYLRILGYLLLPELFAAYHVFHRLLVPRHPPYALSSITNSLPFRVELPLHISSVICVGIGFVFSLRFLEVLMFFYITSDVLSLFL